MNKTILVVDDSAPLRQVLQDVLSTAGFEVLTAADAKAAMNWLDGRKVHLIICDLYMPVTDGLTLVGQIRQLQAYRFTPVMMLSTEKSEDCKERAYAVGAKAWATKPFAPAQMLNAVARLIAP